MSESPGALVVHAVFLQLVAILLAARLCAEIAARLGVPAVVGELVAGIVLGPSLLGWVPPGDAIRLLAEIGIILLLFEVGLETDLHRLIRAGGRAFIVAGGGAGLPFLFGYALSRWVFGMEQLPALFIGGALTATSIGVTVRVLADLGRHESREGQIVLGAAVLDDIFGVVFLALLYEFAVSGAVSPVGAGRVLLFIAVFFALATPAAKFISLVIRRYEGTSAVPGLIPTAVMALVLLFAWLAHAIGAPELLGGFAAGLALSRRFFLPFGLVIRTDPEFAHHVESQMKPIVHLFTPIFFVTVGLSLNLRDVDWGSSWIWGFSGLLLLAAVVGKAGGALLVPEPWTTRAVIACAMVPRGEVGLIFAELGRTSGILPQQAYAGLVLVIAATTLLAPFGLKALYRHFPRDAAA